MAEDELIRIDPTSFPRAGGILEKPERPRPAFAQVLTKLASDPGYREIAIADPSIITRDFKLSLKELQALRQVAVMSGADITNVNRYRVAEFAARANLAAPDIDISCCSCCCCCCGETAVALILHG